MLRRLQLALSISDAPMSLVEELGFIAWRDLSAILDRDSSQHRDWTGLADKMGFPYDVVTRLKDDMTRNYTSPTEGLLKLWQEKQGIISYALFVLLKLASSSRCFDDLLPHISKDVCVCVCVCISMYSRL